MHRNRLEFVPFVLVATLVAATRVPMPGIGLHVPDASFAAFMLAGVFVRERAAFAVLMALAAAIDLAMAAAIGAQAACMTPAYAMLVPAYGAMWLAGRWAAWLFGRGLDALPVTLAAAGAACVVAEVLASGGYYLLSGRFAHPDLSGMVARLTLYFPYALVSTLAWTAFGHAVAASAAWYMAATQSERA